MKSYLKLIGLLVLPLAFVVWYASSPIQIPPPGWKLSKASNPFPSPKEDESPLIIAPPKEDIDTTSLPPIKEVEVEEEKVSALDSASQRILFFGDSMVEGLSRRMNCYAFANGHTVTNIVWYSSTTEIWACTDTLRQFINQVKPTFAMLSIGANEQFVKDANSREACIQQIMKVLGDIPFVWIGVPAWKEDTGINDLTQRVVGKNRYFDSRGLTLQRGRDHMHPTFAAASNWMDSVAVWMASPETAHPIRMDKPTDGEKHTYKTYALQPIRH